jgi:hypothetical protein
MLWGVMNRETNYTRLPLPGKDESNHPYPYCRIATKLGTLTTLSGSTRPMTQLVAKVVSVPGCPEKRSTECVILGFTRLSRYRPLCCILNLASAWNGGLCLFALTTLKSQ